MLGTPDGEHKTVPRVGNECMSKARKLVPHGPQRKPPRAANGTQEQAKSDPGASSDPLRMAEGIKGDKRGLSGSPQGNQVSPRAAFGNEKEVNMGPEGTQKGVQIGAPEGKPNQALAAARAQSSTSEDTTNGTSKPGW